MKYYVVNRNVTYNPGMHHEVHTLEHARELRISDAINLGYFPDETSAVTEAKRYYSNADGCAICCPRAHKG